MMKNETPYRRSTPLSVVSVAPPPNFLNYDTTAMSAVMTESTTRWWMASNVPVFLPEISDTSLTANKLQNIIDSFAASRGYTSTLTSAALLLYLKAAEVTLSSFLCAFRAQNFKAMKDAHGNDASGLLSRIPDSGRDTWDFDAIADVDVASTQSGLEASISNAVWATDYIAKLSDIILPKSMVDLLKYLYLHIFDLRGDNPLLNLVTFYPRHYGPTFDGVNYDVGTVGSTVSIDLLGAGKAVLDGLALCRAMLVYYPDLKPVLNLLGMSSSFVTDVDWSRDLKGQTVSITYDPAVNVLVYNDIPFIPDDFTQQEVTTTQEEFILPFADVNIFNMPDAYSFNLGMLQYAILFRSGVVAGGDVVAMSINLLDSEGNEGIVKLIPPGQLHQPGAAAGYSDAEAAIVDLVSLCQYFTARALPSYSPYNLIYHLEGVDPAVTYDTYYKMGGPGFVTVSDYAYYRDIAKANLLFGGDYRMAMDRVFESINSKVIQV